MAGEMSIVQMPMRVVAPQLSSQKLVDDDTSRLVGLRSSDVNLPLRNHVTRSRQLCHYR